MTASGLHDEMLELIRQNKRREYLALCRANYFETIEVAKSLVPQFYDGTSDPFDALHGRAAVAKRSGDSDEEIRVLETAIDAGTTIPGCYDRLAFLWSNRGEHKKAHQVCARWFDSGRWVMPNSATTSLKLLERLEKLGKKLDHN